MYVGRIACTDDEAVPESPDARIEAGAEVGVEPVGPGWPEAVEACGVDTGLAHASKSGATPKLATKALLKNVRRSMRPPAATPGFRMGILLIYLATGSDCSGWCTAQAVPITVATIATA